MTRKIYFTPILLVVFLVSIVFAKPTVSNFNFTGTFHNDLQQDVYIHKISVLVGTKCIYKSPDICGKFLKLSPAINVGQKIPAGKNLNINLAETQSGNCKDIIGGNSCAVFMIPRKYSIENGSYCETSIGGESELGSGIGESFLFTPSKIKDVYLSQLSGVVSCSKTKPADWPKDL